MKTPHPPKVYSTYKRDEKIRFAADCLRAGMSVDRVAHHLHVQPATIYAWLGRRITAQHSETGRTWEGPRSTLPPGYLYLGNINGPGCDPDAP